MLLKRIAATLLSLAIIISLCSCQAEKPIMEKWSDVITEENDTWNGKTISTAEELAAFSLRVANSKYYSSFDGETITLLADIDLSGKEWIPIGNVDKYFNGTFDGNGHKITGVTISSTGKGEKWVGLFGFVFRESIIKDLAVSGTIIATDGLCNNVGMVAGSSFGKIINCSASGNLSAGGAEYNMAGGVTGHNGGVIENCTSYCTIETNSITTEQDKILMSKAGGIAGENCEGIIKDSINNGQITVLGGVSSVGGIVGENCSGSVLKCTNNGKITARDNYNNFVGGITGCFSTITAVTESGEPDLSHTYSDSLVENCINTGEIYVDNPTDSNRVGGIAGVGDKGLINNCENRSGITIAGGESNSVGGICGVINADISNCFNSGNVMGRAEKTWVNNIGGIAGDNPSGSIQNSYNTGAVSATGGACSAAGIVGSGICSFGTVKNCYNIGTIASESSKASESISGDIYGYITREDAAKDPIENCYWLQQEKTGKTLSESLGTKVILKESGYFTDNSGVLKAEDGTPLKDTTLLDALNSWTVGKEGMHKWVIDPEFNGGYPVLDRTQTAEEKPETVEIPNKVETPETGAGIFGWLFEVLFS